MAKYTRWDLNPHASLRLILNQVRLPTSPLVQVLGLLRPRFASSECVARPPPEATHPITPRIYSAEPGSLHIRGMCAQRRPKWNVDRPQISVRNVGFSPSGTSFASLPMLYQLSQLCIFLDKRKSCLPHLRGKQLLNMFIYKLGSCLSRSCQNNIFSHLPILK